jgi:hypothetical protein
VAAGHEVVYGSRQAPGEGPGGAQVRAVDDARLPAPHFPATVLPGGGEAAQGPSCLLLSGLRLADLVPGPGELAAGLVELIFEGPDVVTLITLGRSRLVGRLDRIGEGLLRIGDSLPPLPRGPLRLRRARRLSGRPRRVAGPGFTGRGFIGRPGRLGRLLVPRRPGVLSLR